MKHDEFCETRKVGFDTPSQCDCRERELRQRFQGPMDPWKVAVLTALLNPIFGGVIATYTIKNAQDRGFQVNQSPIWKAWALGSVISLILIFLL